MAGYKVTEVEMLPKGFSFSVVDDQGELYFTCLFGTRARAESAARCIGTGVEGAASIVCHQTNSDPN